MPPEPQPEAPVLVEEAPLGDFLRALHQEVARADAELQVHQRLALAELSRHLPTVEGISLADQYEKTPLLAMKEVRLTFGLERVKPAWLKRVVNRMRDKPPEPEQYRFARPGEKGVISVEVVVERAEDGNLRVRTSGVPQPQLPEGG